LILAGFGSAISLMMSGKYFLDREEFLLKASVSSHRFDDAHFDAFREDGLIGFRLAGSKWSNAV
jgi:hypothetical protein